MCESSIQYMGLVTKDSEGKCLLLVFIRVRLKLGISSHIIFIITIIYHLHCIRKYFILGIFSFWGLKIDFWKNVLYWGSVNI